MTPEYYADLYKQYSAFLKAPEDNQPKFIASGGTDDQTEWTKSAHRENKILVESKKWMR